MASVDNCRERDLIRNANKLYLVRGLCYSGKYVVRRGDPKNETRYTHRIMFKDDCFTLDGVNYRRVDDPANTSFLKSLEEHGCPDEFEGDGVHRIWIHRRPDDMGWHESEGEFNPNSVSCNDHKGRDKVAEEFKTSYIKSWDTSEGEYINSNVCFDDDNDWEKVLGEFSSSDLNYYNDDKGWDNSKGVIKTDIVRSSDDDEWVNSCHGFVLLSDGKSTVWDVDYNNLFLA